MIRSLGLALAVVALAIACTPSGNTASVSVSLGSGVRQALTAGGVTISHFQLDISCIDGRVDTVRGDVDVNGNFTADVARCAQADVSFSGLTDARNPALLGTTNAVITPPSTDLLFETIRVGTVTFQNDAGYDSVCEVTTPEEPALGQRFALAAAATKTLVLPVVNTTLVCVPATDCADVGTCSLTGATATHVRTVAVPWGDSGTLSLQNLTNTLIFSVAPIGSALAGAVWQPFSVVLLDDSGQPIDRSDVIVNLTAQTSIANGGFVSGDSLQLTHGAAMFSQAAFATAGTLSMTATANVNGVLLSTDPVTVSIGAGLAGALVMTGPASVAAGQTLVVTITASDRFGNPTDLPPIDLSSDDPQSHPVRVGQTTTGVALELATNAGTFGGDSGFALYTAGHFTVTATDANDPLVQARLGVDVTGGPASTLFLTSDFLTYVQDATGNFTVTVADQWGNPTASPGTTVALSINSGAGPTASADTGVAHLQYVFGSTGIYTVQASGAPYPDSNVLSIEVDAPGTTASFVVEPRDLTATAGAGTQVTVTALDAAGAQNASDNTSISIYFSDPKLSSIPTIFANGSVTASFAWQTAGQQTIFVNGEKSATSVPVTVTASTAQATRIVWQPPPQVTPNTPFRMAAVIEDIYGNAVDPRAYGVSIGLMAGTGALNGGYTTNPIGNTVFIENISVNGPSPGAVIVVNGGPSVADSNTFNVHAAGGCPIAYVTPTGAGTGSGCSPANATNSISAALTAVDAVDATVLIAAGTYTEPMSLANRRVVKGGWDASFSVATPLSTPTIIHPPSGTYAVDVTTGTSTNVTLEGLVILAPDIVSGATYAGIVESGATLRVSRCVVSGPYGTVDGEGGAWVVDDPAAATFEANWIATGGLANGSQSASPRHGVYGTGGGGTVAVVSNTFVIADNSRGAAVEYAGSGDWSVTNNLIVGDFTNCAANSGVCAIADQFDGGSIGSAMNNVIFETQAASAPVYRTSGSTLDDANQHSGNFRGNANIAGAGAPDTLFVSLNGPDGHLYTMADNDWHVSGFGEFSNGLIDTDVTCGGIGQAFCGGDGRDIDGDLYASGVGADGP